MKPAIEIMVVDDHHLFRRGLKEVIEDEDDMKIIWEARSAEEAEKQALKLKPDLILMDVDMPGINGIEATRSISALLPETSIVILTVSSLEEHLFEAIQAAAVGYLTKDIPPEGLVRVIRGVAQGEAPLSRAMTSKILKYFRDTSAARSGKSKHELTPRETNILELLSQGTTDREIAETLFISEHTVKKHVQNILRKLHVSNRTAAASLYSRKKQ